MLPDQLSQSPFDAKGLDRQAALTAQVSRVAMNGGSGTDRDAAALALSNIFELGDLWRSLIRGEP
jgi:hypothetical protein